MSTQRIISASSRIPTPDNVTELHYKLGDTLDIIEVIMYADSMLDGDMADFARSIPRNYEGMRSLWSFVRQQIRYKADKAGRENVKSPSKTWHDRYGDCKSMSIFIASVLKNLNIPYQYKFVAYNEQTDVSHVYIVAYLGGREIILDAVHFAFDEEVEYTFDCLRSSGDGNVGACNINGISYPSSHVGTTALPSLTYIIAIAAIWLVARK